MNLFEDTILNLINALGALHFSKRGRLFESNFETENPYEVAIKA